MSESLSESSPSASLTRSSFSFSKHSSSTGFSDIYIIQLPLSQIIKQSTKNCFVLLNIPIVLIEKNPTFSSGPRNQIQSFLLISEYKPNYVFPDK